MSLEKLKVEVELMQVQAAKGAQQLKIAEREEEIKRIKEHVKIQDDKIQELEIKLKSL